MLGAGSERQAKGSTYSSVGTLEHAQLLLRGGILLGRYHSLEGGLGKVPQLVMLALEQDNSAGALAVERGGGVEDGLADDVLDGLVIDGRLLLQGVDGTTALDGIEVLRRHGG